MDQDARDRWSARAHRGRRFCSPVDEDRFAALVETLPLPAAPYSVDFGSGKGAALVQVVQLRGGTGTGVEDLSDLADTVACVEQAGLTPIAVQPSTTAEWDAYEWSLTRSIEQWARESPETADRELFLARSRSMRNSYLRWRRDALGFALVAAVREGP
jgi:hypothetical protein